MRNLPITSRRVRKRTCLSPSRDSGFKARTPSASLKTDGFRSRSLSHMADNRIRVELNLHPRDHAPRRIEVVQRDT